MANDPDRRARRRRADATRGIDLLAFGVVEVLLGAVVAVTTWAVTKAGVAAITLGLAAIAVEAIFRMRYELRHELAPSLEFEMTLAKDHELRQKIERIADDFSDIRGDADPVFVKLAETALVQCNSSIEDLAAGVCSLTRIDLYSRLTDFVKLTKSSLYATSLVNTDEFWEGGGGLEYYQANLEIMRSINTPAAPPIKRVFIAPMTGNLPTATLAAIRQQLDDGLAVFVLKQEPASIDHDLLVDMGIVDEKYTWTIDLAPNTLSVRSVRFAKRPDDLEIAMHRWNRIMAKARPAAEYL
jgi:hypothetical protein